LFSLAVRCSALALKQFEISSGFRLPDRSVLSPDAALVHLERREAVAGCRPIAHCHLCN